MVDSLLNESTPHKFLALTTRSFFERIHTSLQTVAQEVPWENETVDPKPSRQFIRQRETGMVTTRITPVVLALVFLIIGLAQLVTAQDNQPPIVMITAPAEGSSFEENEEILISADARDPDGAVLKVEFFDGGELIGEGQETSPGGVSPAPQAHPQRFTFTWMNPPEGNRSLTAVATDFGGASTTSSPIMVSVGAQRGPFIPAVPEESWTSHFREDRDGDGPRPSDSYVVYILNGNEATGFISRKPDQRWRVVRVNADQFNAYPPENSSPSSQKAKRGLLAWAKMRLRRSLQIEGARKHVMTITERDLSLGPKSVRVESELESGEMRESSVEIMDEDGDGLAESANVQGFLFLPSMNVTPDFSDVNDDGVMDFMGVPYRMSGGKVNRVYLPLADTNGDGVPDSPAFDLDQDGRPDPGLSLFPFAAGPSNPEVEYKLYFAQFGDGQAGGADIFSQILLFNLDPDQGAEVKIILKDDDGNLLTVDLDGEEVQGEKELMIQAGGSVFCEQMGKAH